MPNIVVHKYTARWTNNIDFSQKEFCQKVFVYATWVSNLEEKLPC